MSNAARKIDFESQNTQSDASSLKNLLAAIDRAQAVIEFNLDGTVITECSASQNMLHRPNMKSFG